MRLDPEVVAVGAQYGGALSLMQLVQSIVTAEGNIIAAVKCSIPDLETRAAAKSRSELDEALHFTYQTAIHRLAEWAQHNHPSEFAVYMRSTWAPLNAANDPKNLNSFWATNVSKLWGAEAMSA